MEKLKITSWNIEHLNRLFDGNIDNNKKRRRDAIKEEIFSINPDILCILEGPKGEQSIDKFSHEVLEGKLVAIKSNTSEYRIKGDQWIWFLVKDELAADAALLAHEAWNEFAGRSWKVHYWGDFSESNHNHYRHPQVLIFHWHGQRIEFIGLHLKSKFVPRGESDWKAGGQKKNEFIQKAIKARIKLTTEATNVRKYIDSKFNQITNPAIFVMGDLNDGPGKEYFENNYLFFDLLSNIQGEVFFAKRFLNHALFDFPEHLRWSVYFEDFIDENRNPKILLDHILFTQPLVDGSLSVAVETKAGLVEHEIHELVNAGLNSKQITSDHRPISLYLTYKDN